MLSGNKCHDVYQNMGNLIVCIQGYENIFYGAYTWLYCRCRSNALNHFVITYFEFQSKMQNVPTTDLWMHFSIGSYLGCQVWMLVSLPVQIFHCGCLSFSNVQKKEYFPQKLFLPWLVPVIPVPHLDLSP